MMAAPAAAPPAPAEPRLRTRDVLIPGGPADFGSLLLSAPVLAGLEAAGFLRPSPVQLKAIPLGRCGLDLIVQAKSGTGKTCVFSTIALDSLILENPATQILVLAPTREIAVQIHAVITTIGIKMEGLECHVFIGGTPLNQDKMRLKKCHIAVGSPGRIKQLIELDCLNTASIRLFILDEADKLLEEGSFQEQVNWIYSSLPANKQMLAVSATYPESLANALTRYMRDPTFVRLNPTDPSLIGLKQYYKIVNSHSLPHKTFEEKAQHLQELFSKIPFNQALVFSNLHSRAQHLAEVLTSKGFPAECISGSMNQNQRLDAMAKLKQFHCRVLISTDLTSRGIDAEKVNLVINLDVPLDWETYMHRIGRAGRFGTLGLAVTYCCRGEEENMMMKIAQKCNLQLLPLPEPVPTGLMEQFAQWDVEVTAIAHADASVNAHILTHERPEESMHHTHINSCAQIPQCDPAVPGENSSMSRPRRISKQKQLLKGCPDHANTEKTSKSPKTLNVNTQQRNQMATACKTTEQNVDQHLDKETLKNTLPKIPCLSSFKNPQPPIPWSFAEFVEDYEYFIKEGLEKRVEIIRSYTGPGDQYQHPKNGAFEKKGMEETMHSVADSVSFGDTDSDSNSYSSRASSHSRGIKSYFEASSDTQERGSDVLIIDQASLNYSQSVSCSLGPVEHQQMPQIQKHSPVKKKVVKQNSKRCKKSRHQQSPSPPKRGAQEDCSYSTQDESSPGFPDETQNYEEYWKSYYRTWQSYYASHSYYRKFHRHFNWMTAYHANSVYLQELLKSDW
ncbi:probable ATP-dependent RNA helicase DDX20 [Trachemys scripta elegans]|uniref:probable ATP-dependent RNA helicase DDX20 n=1 Tax=Trachemys scripta elegans TaxID=31138 RepID=UPI001551F320|nr:probable ATP-dependent RNA helicase DDX20 [Trachemys scripta elegans]